MPRSSADHEIHSIDDDLIAPRHQVESSLEVRQQIVCEKLFASEVRMLIRYALADRQDRQLRYVQQRRAGCVNHRVDGDDAVLRYARDDLELHAAREEKVALADVARLEGRSGR